MSEKSSETKKKLNKKVLIGVSVGAAVILLILSLGIFLVTGNGIARGVTVEGVSLAGMSEKKAAEFIAGNIGKEIPDEKITVVFEGTEHELRFAEMINGFDAAKTAKKAYNLGKGKNSFDKFFTRLGLLFNPEDIKLEPVLNEQIPDALLAELNGTLKTVKVDDYYFMEQDRLKLVFGTPGDFIDGEALKEKIKDYMREGMGGRIVLTAVYSQPEEFDVDKIYDEIATRPAEAYFHEVDGKKYLSPAKNGYEFDKNELQKAIDENRGVNTGFYFEPEVLKPENKEVDYSGLFTDTLAEYTSLITDNDPNRLNNVHLAATKINGLIINPDEVFSYLSYVEPITVEGGYKVANVYANGKIQQDVGGGVCQVSSALYSALLNANIEIVKRFAHSLTVAYVPYGQDATVAYGEIDLRFKNNTNEPIKIVAESDDAGVYITLLGKKTDPSIAVKIENVTTQTLVPEVVTVIDEKLQPGEEVVDYWGKTGYVVQTYKHIYKDGVYVETVHVSTSRYKKIDKTIRKGPDAPTTETENPSAEEENLPGEDISEEALAPQNTDVIDAESADAPEADLQPETSEEGIRR